MVTRPLYALNKWVMNPVYCLIINANRIMKPLQLVKIHCQWHQNIPHWEKWLSMVLRRGHFISGGWRPETQFGTVFQTLSFIYTVSCCKKRKWEEGISAFTESPIKWPQVQRGSSQFVLLCKEDSDRWRRVNGTKDSKIWPWFNPKQRNWYRAFIRTVEISPEIVCHEKWLPLLG